MNNKDLFFEHVVLTKKSYEFVSHVVSGKQMRFTKAQLGDGEITDPSNLADIDNLINYKTDAEIISVRGNGNQAIIDINISSDDITEAFKFREVGLFAEIEGEEILYAYLNAGTKFDYLTPNAGGQIFRQTLQFVVAVGNAENVEIVFSKADIPEASITLTMLSDDIIDYIDNIKNGSNDHIAKTILDAEGAHGLMFDESQAKLKYNKNGSWIDIPTGQAAESEINSHKLASIASESGAHNFRYDIDSKKLQYKTGTAWKDVELEGTGDISVTGLTADTLRAGVTVVITRGDQEIDRIVGNYTDDADALATDIMAGKTAYVKGQKIEGSIITTTGDIQLNNPSVVNERLRSPTIPDGFYKNATVSFGRNNLYPESIKAGTNIYGVSGTYTNDANATSADILSGKTAYVKGSKISGSISTYSGDRSISQPTISGSNLITPTISNGYYSNARFSFPKGNLSPENIKSGINIFGVTGTYTDKIGDVLFVASFTTRSGNFDANFFSLDTTLMNNYSATSLRTLNIDFKREETVKMLVLQANGSSADHVYFIDAYFNTVPFNTLSGHNHATYGPYKVNGMAYYKAMRPDNTSSNGYTRIVVFIKA